MSIITLSKQKKRVQVGEFEVDSPVVYEYFSSLQTKDRDNLLLKAIYIGVLALMEDRIAAFLSKTTNELGTELESLKLIFDMKQEIFFRSSVKGRIAEEEIAEFLTDYFGERGLKDEVVLTGNADGKIPKNKTGDIVCLVNGAEDLRIVLECKFDKNIRLGDISDRNVFGNKTDTVWSQLIEAEANREGRSSIIVLDTSSVDGALLKQIENVRYIPSVGFAVVVDSMKGDYSNLTIAYALSRDIALKAQPIKLDKGLLAILVNRMIKDLTDTLSIRKLVTANIDNSKKVLQQLEKSMLSIEFSSRYLTAFLAEGTLTKDQLLDFYFADDVKEDFKVLDKEIKAL